MTSVGIAAASMIVGSAVGAGLRAVAAGVGRAAAPVSNASRAANSALQRATASSYIQHSRWQAAAAANTAGYATEQGFRGSPSAAVYPRPNVYSGRGYRVAF